jgi:hypothetical protein
MKYILFLVGLFVITQHVFPQSVIYKKNGEAISVYNLNVTEKNLSYNLPGDPQDMQRLMSVSIVDSLRHEDGTTDVFINSGLSHIISAEDQKPFNRFLLGVDVAAITFYHNIKASFEYLPGKGYLGLYAAHSLNMNPQNFMIYDNYLNQYFYGNIMKLMHWNTRAGINAYIFPPGSFRLSSGLHYVRGRYTEEKLIHMNKEPWTTRFEFNNKSFSGLFLSPGLNWQYNKYFRFNLAIDSGIYNYPRVAGNSILRSEISLTF